MHGENKSASSRSLEQLTDDEMVNVAVAAQILGVSEAWLNVGRMNTERGGYGPPFYKFAERAVRYNVGDLRKWIISTRADPAEWAKVTEARENA